MLRTQLANSCTWSVLLLLIAFSLPEIAYSQATPDAVEATTAAIAAVVDEVAAEIDSRDTAWILDPKWAFNWQSPR